MSINGQLTLGENIGDLGGLSIAHLAWEMYLDDHSDGPAEELAGYSGQQGFFTSWAQGWRNLCASEEAQRNRLINDPHSPPAPRVNGVVRYIATSYGTFALA